MEEEARQEICDVVEGHLSRRASDYVRTYQWGVGILAGLLLALSGAFAQQKISGSSFEATAKQVAVNTQKLEIQDDVIKELKLALKDMATKQEANHLELMRMISRRNSGER